MSRLGSKAIVALAIVAGGAQSAPVSIAGGDLDPSITSADVYEGVPVRASHVAGAACRAARNYVEYVRAGRFAEVARLFAQNAVLLEPAGGTLRGHDEISRFYSDTIGKMKPDIIDVAYTGDDRDCMVALAVRITIAGQPRYKLASVDHFSLESMGKFSRMVAFARLSAAAK
jgi:hypothetical protein